MNRRIAFALILALLAQSFAPGVALALRPEGAPLQTVLICTGDGIKQIVLEAGAADPAPPPQHTCPCGVLCAACALPCGDRDAAPVVYVEPLRFALPAGAEIPIAARAPPGHQVRAPPSSH